MRKCETGTISDLTLCLNEAIAELSAPIAIADGSIASATSQLNLLLDWARSGIARADGTLANAIVTYNKFISTWVWTLEQWFPRSRRSSGDYDTQNRTIPSDINYVRIELDVDPTDFTTSDLSVTANIEISTDEAQTWVKQMIVKWVGGIPPTLPPDKIWKWRVVIDNIGNFGGALVRVHFSTSGSFRWGLLGEMF